MPNAAPSFPSQNPPPRAVQADPPVPPLEEARSLDSVQPGGGFCFGLEAAWGRWRRRWLRRIRPGYVTRMEKARQGRCERCPHDVIDARDLKLVRNGCGYWFREEDDRFRWRSQLRLARAGLAEVVFSSVLCLAVGLPLGLAATVQGGWPLWLATAVVAGLWFQLVWFFRDPPRAIPDDPSALVSPSDGVVTHLDEVDAKGFPGDRAFRVSIYLSPFDVHLNRIPRDAKVVSVRYFRGRFLNARRPDCVQRNEQLWTDFVEPNGRPLRVKQISGALARRLVCWLKLDEQVRMGDRYGMIKYGSRTEVLLPTQEALELAVRVGQRVNAGSTVLLRFTGNGDGRGERRA